jgi:hypothetical protein
MNARRNKLRVAVSMSTYRMAYQIQINAISFSQMVYAPLHFARNSIKLSTGKAWKVGHSSFIKSFDWEIGCMHNLWYSDLNLAISYSVSMMLSLCRVLGIFLRVLVISLAFKCTI